MTRASLLHILDHVSEISETEIRELEQLAAAFPYCQTAHLLLAKAAHDRGSMLASQRLRRAATYATDRHLLRQLLDQRPPAPAPATTTYDLAAPEALIAAEPPLPAEPVSAVSDTEAPAEELPLIPADSPVSDAATEVNPEPTAQEEPEATAEILSAVEQTSVPESKDPEAEFTEKEVVIALEAPAPTTPEPVVPDDVLPAVAPPIRPPVETGISRFEFDLVEPGLPEPSSYQLPGLDDEGAEAPLPLSSALPPFRADEQVGYALGAGSRLGYDLQPHDGYTLSLPADAFFEPDALLLAYLKAHQPKPTASSLDLINRFLKTQPRIKTSVGPPPAPEEQDDLSVRSTRPAPALASESLAKIMIKQGKVDKAIEIYERLMLRQPEKKAYFADQIHQLKQLPE